MQTNLAQKIAEKHAIVGIIGLGYVGLPLAKAFIEGGFRILGFDVDQGKIHQLEAGQSYIGHLKSEWISTCTGNGSLRVTADMARLDEPDAILICVPTPLTPSRDPDLSYVESTAHEIAKRLRPGQLVVLESTTYPGTTRDVMLPILAASGLKCGTDFFLAYSPEREDPGNPDFSAGRIPKVIGGYDSASAKLAEELYRHAVSEVVPVSSCEVAEACKVLENTYRAVNIALVNELKKVFDRLGIDVWEVINAAKTKPFGFQAFYPGPGLGGHCIPIDPFYLSWVARKYDVPTRFIELAGEVNASMPDYVVERVALALNDARKPVNGSKICILGIAYKRDVDDPRESPSFRIMELLAARGAKISYSDPHVPMLPRMRHHRTPEMASSKLSNEFLGEQDCVLIVTDHRAFDYSFIASNSQLIVDTRNALGNLDSTKALVVKA
ncbi:nucleotide sugar dehydrogenase [Lacipirellula limnantheis]|uniref:UDP-N-acetyl-D-glucosamine 6-dehydrogenase n=1 Tax=Lacipirellula limnantheis TaxID=2528024 RepID=A0A517TYA3_9BACT|nr:nucleotide sugar dehydrogenase [Lacipirellula limnantheis]QDT73354.1 UDP-N-acetyl-D-glucosamine 6-dehydrogenase [Lacipirellula limnantheis]